MPEPRMVVTNIEIESEETVNYIPGSGKRPMTVEDILQDLKLLDPDDLDALQQGLYDYLWENDGVLHKRAEEEQ